MMPWQPPAEPITPWQPPAKPLSRSEPPQVVTQSVIKLEPPSVEQSVPKLKPSKRTKRKPAKEKPAKKVESEDPSRPASPKWEPPLWREQLENIKKMREARDAPVDTMGAAALPDKTAPPVVRQETGVVLFSTVLRIVILLR